ncbi:MAG: hypothetical protein JWM18_3532 [Chloroflexi bacterium]|jgi:hypothetical protein|nr:hypothetical protein [Chloroflexota bacterium]
MVRGSAAEIKFLTTDGGSYDDRKARIAEAVDGWVITP